MIMKQHVFYNFELAKECGEKRHAIVVIHELVKKHGFTILRSVAESQNVVFNNGSWQFWVESNEPVSWPPYITELEWTEPPPV